MYLKELIDGNKETRKHQPTYRRWQQNQTTPRAICLIVDGIMLELIPLTLRTHCNLSFMVGHKWLPHYNTYG